MSEIFRLNKKGDAVIHPDAVKVTKHLKKISQDKLLFIIRAYDYDSPYHKFPKEDRIRKAKRHTWARDDIDPALNDPDFDLAVEEYQGLQYDSTREMRDTLLTKSTDIQQEIRFEKDPTKLEKLYKILVSTNTLVKSLQREIDVNDQLMEEIKGDRKISLVEVFQLRMKQQKKEQKVAEQRSGTLNMNE